MSDEPTVDQLMAQADALQARSKELQAEATVAQDGAKAVMAHGMQVLASVRNNEADPAPAPPPPASGEPQSM